MCVRAHVWVCLYGGVIRRVRTFIKHASICVMMASFFAWHYSPIPNISFYIYRHSPYTRRGVCVCGWVCVCGAIIIVSPERPSHRCRRIQPTCPKPSHANVSQQPIKSFLYDVQIYGRTQFSTIAL